MLSYFFGNDFCLQFDFDLQVVELNFILFGFMIFLLFVYLFMKYLVNINGSYLVLGVCEKGEENGLVWLNFIFCFYVVYGFDLEL